MADYFAIFSRTQVAQALALGSRVVALIFLGVLRGLCCDAFEVTHLARRSRRLLLQGAT